MYANDKNSHRTPFDDERILYSDLEPDEESSHALTTFGQRIFKRFGIKVVTHAVIEEENDEGDFDVRITYVPDDVLASNTEPDLVEVRLLTLGKDAWQRTSHKRLLTSLVLLFLVILLVSISLFGHISSSLFPLLSTSPQAAPTTHFTYNDTPPNRTETNHVSAGPDDAVVIAAQAMPQYCPTGTMLGQGKQVGNFPVWLSGIDAETAMVHLPTLVLKTTKGWKGWVVHLQIAGRYRYLTTINLTAFNIYGAATPLFHNPYTSLDSPRLFIDPKHPMGFLGANIAPNIGTWDISLYLPNAGCYAISTSWGQANWFINFAAGR